MEALIRHFLHVQQPEQLSDEQFGALFQQAEWLRRNPQARGISHAKLLA